MLDAAQSPVPILAAGAIALALVGCGSSGGSNSYNGSAPAKSAPASVPKPTSASQKLALEADEDGQLYFKPTKLKAKSGSMTLVMDNPKTTGKQHGIAVEGNGVDQDGRVVSPGAKSLLTVTLKPGKYEFYCPFDGHKQAGMKGTLTVE